MENYIAFITLATGTKHKITQETYEQILEADKDDLIMLPNWTTFKNSAVMEIQDINAWVDPEGSYHYGQQYSEIESRGFTGIIENTKRLNSLKLLAEGIKKSIEKRKLDGLESPKAEQLLQHARNKYTLLKTLV